MSCTVRGSVMVRVCQLWQDRCLAFTFCLLSCQYQCNTSPLFPTLVMTNNCKIKRLYTPAVYDMCLSTSSNHVLWKPAHRRRWFWHASSPKETLVCTHCVNLISQPLHVSALQKKKKKKRTGSSYLLPGWLHALHHHTSPLFVYTARVCIVCATSVKWCTLKKKKRSLTQLGCVAYKSDAVWKWNFPLRYNIWWTTHKWTLQKMASWNIHFFIQSFIHFTFDMELLFHINHDFNE